MTAPRSLCTSARRWNTMKLLTAGLAALGSLTVSPVRAEDLIVKFDQSQILRLSRPAAEIIVGNPSIADVTIQTGNILVVTGKSFGITNIIALDAERNIIQDQRVSVRRDEAGVVNLHKGISRHTFACMPQCNPTITVGDDVGFMSSVLTQSKNKMTFSEGVQQDNGQNGGN
jgi:Flp pilus assembly secretin CpaC